MQGPQLQPKPEDATNGTDKPGEGESGAGGGKASASSKSKGGKGGKADKPGEGESGAGGGEGTGDAARDIKDALQEAQEEQSADFQAYEEGKSKNLLEQAKRGGAVDLMGAQKAAERAQTRAREKRLSKRQPGIYVVEPFVCEHPTGGRIDCPIGMRLPDSLVSFLGADRIRDFEDKGLVDDLR